MPNSRQGGADGRITAEQEPFLAVRTLATDYPAGFVIEAHRHGWHQLVHAISGAMTVGTGEACWMVPMGLGVFVPAQCVHTIRTWGTVKMRTLYWRTDAIARPVPELGVLDISPLLRELILCTVERGALDTRNRRDAHLIGLMEAEIRDALEAGGRAALRLPLPEDSRARGLAHLLMERPAEDLSLDRLAIQHGAARRTMERRFREETGIPLGLWRQKARLLHSVQLLAEGRSVTDAALETGYASVSAFIAAYKATFGHTPGKPRD